MASCNDARMIWAWRTVLGLTAVTGVTGLIACGDGTRVPPLGNVVNSRVLHREIPITVNSNFDVLFVIDSSPAMAPFATKLAGNARELIQLLTPPFGPDLHIGVVTADPADAGALRQTSSVADSFITQTLQFDTSVQTNVTGSIDDAFAALADVGSAGSASIQPLAMAQAALAPGVNPGFLRDDAALGIVFITAGDDASAGTVDDYVTAFKQLKPDPNQVVVSVASGPCTTASLSAPDAPRMTTLVGEFPNRGAQVAICDDSLAPLVSLEFELLKVALGAPCIDEPLASPPSCAIWLEHRIPSEQRIIEQCPSSTIPCWSLVSDPQDCTAPPSLSLELEPHEFRTTGEVFEEIECVLE
jgi:hypothetical protein